MSIIEGIKTLLAVLGLLRQLYSLIRDFQKQQEERKRKQAFDEMEKAKTPEEVADANEDITRRLP